MTTHLKPLFHRRLLQDAVRGAAHVSDEQARVARQWAAGIRTSEFERQTEKNLQGVFLARILDEVLGYAQAISGGPRFHMKAEHSLKASHSGRTPDACLGFFDGSHEQIRAVVELKAPRTDLDAKQGGAYGNLTPVEQAFGYASKLDGCRWVIVSNFETLRLYRYGSGQGSAHVFDLNGLSDPAKLTEFVFLLGRSTLLGQEHAKSAIEELSERTHVKEGEITKSFYAFYKSVRLGLFEHLVGHNPPQPGAAAAAHEVWLLEQAQKILDRVLFICFCEDTGLLPPDVIRQALTAGDSGFVRVPRWQQLIGLFNAVDQGNPPLRINGYNGGLFAHDPGLERLTIADDQLDGVLALSSYDFETDLNVNILGHIFEQSIADLEAIRAEIRGEDVDPKTSKRKKQGVYYTPEFVTRFMVRRTVGAWLDERFTSLKASHREPGDGGRMNKRTETALWLAYLEQLKAIKVVDPACGSGAFLVAAFDYLHGEYRRVNRKFAELTGDTEQQGLFDLDRQILQQNLFGVDLNPESVEITKLSLWLKTASSDRPLNNLDNNVRCGNSVVAPPVDDADGEALAGLARQDVRPFDWRAAFPQVFERGGFDVCLGNPPYVRQETIAPLKPYLQRHYTSFHGAADLYVYFYEKGLNLLAPGGKLAYIVTNKWFRAGYAEPLRTLFARCATFEEIIDFGHAPIFEDADTFPCIVIFHRKVRDEPNAEVLVCSVPRDRDKELSLEQYVDEHGFVVPWQRYGASSWSLEPPAVDALMEKIRRSGIPLREFSGTRPLYGLKTGLNEAFLIDDETRRELVARDPRCDSVIRPYLRGRDIKRWAPTWEKLWMIVLKSSLDEQWPWTSAASEAEAEGIFASAYSSLHARMKAHEPALRKRSDHGRFWWELRSCDYYAVFDAPKIVHTDIAWQPQFAISDEATYLVNTCYLWPIADPYIVAVLNSSVMWSYLWRTAQHGKDEALRLFGAHMETLPIPVASDQLRAEVGVAVAEMSRVVRASAADADTLVGWLRHEFGVVDPGARLFDPFALSADSFISEVRKTRGKGAARLTPADIKVLGETHASYLPAHADRTRSLAELELRTDDLVREAFALKDSERALLDEHAPPRSPRGRTQ